MAIKIIAAIAANGVIGRDGEIPFHLPADLARFREITMGHTVVQGHKTFASIVKRLNKPLPGRENYVLTHHPESIRVDGVRVIDDFNKIVEMSRHRDVFVIGGAELYRLALPVAEEMFLTRVQSAPSGDTFFPIWNEKQWTRVASGKHLKDAKNDHDFIFEHYVRRSSPFIEMKNIRTPEQMQDMQEILDLGVCPFCEDFIKGSMKWHQQPILWKSLHWFVTYNNYAYPWAKPVLADEPEGDKVHLLLVLNRHAETANEVPADAWGEIGTILRWAEDKYNIEGAGLFLRFGEPLWTGGTIRHIHAHIAQRKDLETPAAFYLSSFVG